MLKIVSWKCYVKRVIHSLYLSSTTLKFKLLTLIWTSTCPGLCFQFMVSHPMQDKFNIDKMIDISPHAPYGSKQARNAAKERAAQRYSLALSRIERLHLWLRLLYSLLFYINGTVEIIKYVPYEYKNGKCWRSTLDEHLGYVPVLPNVENLFCLNLNSLLFFLTSLPLFLSYPHLKWNDWCWSTRWARQGQNEKTGSKANE